MASLTVKTNFDFSFLNELKKAYPEAMFGVLNEVGHEGRRLMKAGLLSGSPINLQKYPKDKAGRNTVSWKVLRNFKGVRINSYPLNLYEPRKQYRKFSPVISSKLSQIVDSYGKTKFQKIINEFNK